MLKLHHILTSYISQKGESDQARDSALQSRRYSVRVAMSDQDNAH